MRGRAPVDRIEALRPRSLVEERFIDVGAAHGFDGQQSADAHEVTVGILLFVDESERVTLAESGDRVVRTLPDEGQLVGDLFGDTEHLDCGGHRAADRAGDEFVGRRVGERLDRGREDRPLATDFDTAGVGSVGSFHVEVQKRDTTVFEDAGRHELPGLRVYEGTGLGRGAQEAECFRVGKAQACKERDERVARLENGKARLNGGVCGKRPERIAQPRKLHGFDHRMCGSGHAAQFGTRMQCEHRAADGKSDQPAEHEQAVSGSNERETAARGKAPLPMQKRAAEAAQRSGDKGWGGHDEAARENIGHCRGDPNGGFEGRATCLG